MTRLLIKTIRLYLFYSFVVLLVTIPLFYFLIKNLMARDADRALIAQKNEIVRKLDRATLYDPFDLLNALEPDINLFPTPAIRQFDTLYTVNIVNRDNHKWTPYRVLSSNVVIHGNYYMIQLKSSLVNNEDLLQNIVLVQTILLLLIGAGLVLINRMLTKRVWGPFYKTVFRLKTYRVETEGALRFEGTDITEFNDLNNAVEQLTERSRQVYQSQKEFTENAAHEMQTPLAILQSRLELLMQTQPLTEEQATHIGALDDASTRLSKLNRSLLLLARIENNQYPEVEDVDLEDTCRRVVKMLEPQADVKQVDVNVEFLEPACIKANKTLIEVMVSNLVTNAIRYNVEKGHVRVVCRGNVLAVQNTSKAERLHEERIYERFHKGSSNSQSIGLGLAIVKNICALYGYEIQYNYHDPLHEFLVVFH
jgi:signal transduction histidine kinase